MVKRYKHKSYVYLISMSSDYYLPSYLPYPTQPFFTLYFKKLFPIKKQKLKNKVLIKLLKLIFLKIKNYLSTESNNKLKRPASFYLDTRV